MSDHEHDEDDNCIVPDDQQIYLPNWSFKVTDIVGISFAGAAGVLMSTAQMCQLLSREFQAAANYGRDKDKYRRWEREERANRRLLADDLASLERGEFE